MATWTGRHLAAWSDYKFVVFFSEKRPNTGREPFQFTGTLVHDDFVLTAAHCLFDGNQEPTVDVQNLTIMFSDGQKRIGAADICPSFRCCPHYLAETSKKPIAFDAALVRLREAAGVQTVDLSLDDDSVFPDKTTYAETVGWNLSGPDRLWRCPTRFHRYSQKSIHQCGKFQTTAATKDGDSGGPLIVKDDKGSRIQIGSHSGSRQQQLTRWSRSKYSYSTRIAHANISDWIKRELQRCNRGSTLVD